MGKNTLVIMAAGLGSRYGGVKQLEPVGPNGEIIMDYSIYDAIEAGFEKVVFIIRRDIEKDFKEVIGDRIKKMVEVEYVYQEVNFLPEGYQRLMNRTKPWGTGHAVLSCIDTVTDPFAVINADDYYGKEAFKKVYDFLEDNKKESYKYNFCMASFVLGNTLSENGSVSRGVCRINEENKLIDVIETVGIIKDGDKVVCENQEGHLTDIDINSSVSMNMWGFTPEFLLELEAHFYEFLKSIKTNGEKEEFYLPAVVASLIKSGRADVSVLKTNDKWFGVTYKEDRESVIKNFRKLIDEGVYPNKLFN